MAIRHNDRRVRELAAEVIGISPKEIIDVVPEAGLVLINFRDSMRLSREERMRMQNELTAQLGVQVSFT